jgi:hypothetical protein
MKKLLLLFALLPIGLMGQTDTKTLYTSSGSWNMSMAQIKDPSIHEEPSKTDTVAVWIDCADTTGRRIAYNVSVNGYIIKKVTGHYWGSPEPNADGTVYAIAVEYPIWEIIGYLDSFKRPLTGYLVWKTKEINSK